MRLAELEVLVERVAVRAVWVTVAAEVAGQVVPTTLPLAPIHWHLQPS
jgi:hypothetical protein